VRMKLGKPTQPLGGYGAKKWHLFGNKRSLCGSYMYSAPYEVSEDDLEEGGEHGDKEICKSCRQKAGL